VTDEFGFGAIENPVHVHDIHATILHQLGIDHEKLTFRSQGLDFRLTGVDPAKVIKPIVA
jgi:arylsulfatase A-like enzyme